MSVLELEFTNDQKVANCEYRFTENGYGYVNEVLTQFELYPTGFDLGQDDTARFFWLPLTNGPRSSGVDGAPDGTNGWSNAIGFANRNDAPAPDGYKFFSYCYHMDQPNDAGELQMTDAVVNMEEWNTIQGYVRVNSYSGGSANNDGVMRYWVNGEEAFSRENLRFTTVDDNRIEGLGPMGYIVGNIQGTYYYDNHRIWIGDGESEESNEPIEDEEVIV